MTFENVKQNIVEMPSRDLQYLYAVGLKLEKTDPKFDKTDKKILNLMYEELAGRFVDQAPILIDDNL